MEGVAGLIRMAFKQLNIEPSSYGIQVNDSPHPFESRQMF